MEASSEKTGVNQRNGWLSLFVEPPSALRMLIAAGLLIFLFGWGGSYVARAVTKTGDYYKYVDMGSGVIKGFNPYDADQEKNRWPPFVAVAYAPLAIIDHFSPAASRIIFLLLSYWAFYDAVKIVVRRLYGKKLAIWPRAEHIAITGPAIALALLLCARYLSDSARYIQPTFVLLWLSVKALAFLEAKRDGKAGLLTGLAISLKLTPLVWLGYFIFRGRWKAVVATLLWTAVFFASPFAAIGPQRAQEYYRSWLSADKMYASIPTRASNETVFAMFERWVGDSLSPWAEADPLYGYGAGGHPWVLTLTLLFLCILGAAWMFCAGDVFHDRAVPESIPRRARRIIEEGLVLSASLYASPLSWKHYYMLQVYLLLGIFAVLAWDLAQGWKRGIWALSLIILGAFLQSNLWVPFTSATTALRIQEQSFILWGSLLYFAVGLIYLRSLPNRPVSS